MRKFARFIGVGSTAGFLFSRASSVLADEASLSGGVGGGEGTASSLPNAGVSGLTYLIFAAGVMLFIYGMLKLVSSYTNHSK